MPFPGQYHAFEKVAGKKAPAAVRIFADAVTSKLLGNDPKSKEYSAEDFTPQEMEAIRQAIQTAQSEGRKYIGYGDYPTKYDKYADDSLTIFDELYKLYTDPGRSAMLTLGMANFDDQGVVHDTYDFAAAPDQHLKGVDIMQALTDILTKPGGTKLGNFVGNVVGLRDGTGTPFVIKTMQDAEQ
jgi:hypothetical protein